MKNKNLFWGLFFILSAIFVITSQSGFFWQIGAVSIIATILLAAFFIQSVIDRSFFGIFISLAFLYMIYSKPFNLLYISPWQLLTAAILLSIGCSIIFKKNKLRGFNCNRNASNVEFVSETIDDNNPYANVSFGASSKFLHGDAIKTGQFYVSLGELEVFFDQCSLSPDGAEILLECSLGSMKLFIPKNWQVFDNLHITLGEVSNKRYLSLADDNSPKLYLTGNVMLGSIEIHYI